MMAFDLEVLRQRLHAVLPTHILVQIYDVPLVEWIEGGEDLAPDKPARRKRRPTIASVAQQAAKAGIDIATVTFKITADGVEIVPGKLSEPEHNDWDD